MKKTIGIIVVIMLCISIMACDDTNGNVEADVGSIIGRWAGSVDGENVAIVEITENDIIFGSSTGEDGYNVEAGTYVMEDDIMTITLYRGGYKAFKIEIEKDMLKLIDEETYELTKVKDEEKNSDNNSLIGKWEVDVEEKSKLIIEVTEDELKTTLSSGDGNEDFTERTTYFIHDGNIFQIGKEGANKGIATAGVFEVNGDILSLFGKYDEKDKIIFKLKKVK